MFVPMRMHQTCGAGIVIVYRAFKNLRVPNQSALAWRLAFAWCEGHIQRV